MTENDPGYAASHPFGEGDPDDDGTVNYAVEFRIKLGTSETEAHRKQEQLSNILSIVLPVIGGEFASDELYDY